MKVFIYSLLSLCLLVSPVLGQQKTKEKPNPLVHGKLMYVGRMPENIDSWVVYDLKAWGKYTPTRNPEGVDLTMKAYAPKTRTRYIMRNGVPQPSRVPERGSHKRIMFTIDVADWVTNRLVWQANILDRKPKHDRPGKLGEEIDIDVRGLSTEQIAQSIVRALHSYVDYLASQHASH